MNDPIKAEQDVVTRPSTDSDVIVGQSPTTYREAVNTHGIDVIKPHKEMPTPRGFETYRNDRTPYSED